MIRTMFVALAIALGLVNVPAFAASTHATNEADEWAEYHAEALVEYEDEFTRLFNSMEYKRSKNGRSMIRREGETSFRFVKSA